MIVSPPAIAAASITVTAGALLWAAYSDLRLYLIPNRVPVAIAAAYAVIAGILPVTFVVGGFLTGLAVLAVGTLIFARGWMGGGDVKLLAAVALWAGPSFLSVFGLIASLSGAVLAILMLSPLRKLLPAPSADALALTGADDRAGRQPMPFGVPIAIGGLSLVAFYFPLLR